MLLPDQVGINLICPSCRHPLARVDQTYLCQDNQCRRAYPIVDHIPKLVVDDGEVLALEQWQALKQPAT